MYSVREDGVILRDGSPVMCSYCGKEIKESDLTTALPNNPTDDDFHFSEDSDGCIFCRDCSRDLEHCEDCGGRHHRDDMEYVDYRNGYICEDCINDNYIRCNDCDEFVHRDDVHSFELFTGEFVDLCESCAEDYYECEDCGRMVHRDDVEFVNGDPYCPECAEGERRDNVIHSYHFSEDPAYNMDYLGIEERTRHPMIGVELEVESTRYGSNSKLNDMANDVRSKIGEDNCVICHDCSLDDGFEIISCPANLKHHKETLDWKDALMFLSENGFRSHNGGHCGLHTHIDREYFKGQDMDDVEAKFFISFRNNMEWIKLFSRRRNYDYCRPNGYDDYEVSNIDKFVAPPSKTWVKNKKQSDRYCALNFHPDDTIEVRIFRGTLKFETFMATLEMVDLWAYIVKHCDETNICNVTLNTFKDIAQGCNFKYFLDYIKSRVEPNDQTSTLNQSDNA